MMQPAKHIPSLDGFRAISILIVAASHCHMEHIVPGGLGVTIFFFLSGYLISTLLQKEFSRNGLIAIRDFYIRRALRLAPPLLLTLAIAYTLLALGALGGGRTLFGILSQLFYFANFYQIFFYVTDGVPKGTEVFWSLAVEEHFYIVYPLFFASLMFAATKRRVLPIFGLLCIGVLSWRLYLALQPNFSVTRTYYGTDTRFDSIIFGCALAFGWNPARTSATTGKMTSRHWSIFLLGIASIGFSIAYRNPLFRETLRYTLQGFALMPIFYFAIKYSADRPFTWMNHPIVNRLGVYSYSMYLSHMIFAQLIIEHLHVKPNPLVLYAAVLALAIAYAALVDRYIDARFRGLRARFQGSHAKRASLGAVEAA